MNEKRFKEARKLLFDEKDMAGAAVIFDSLRVNKYNSLDLQVMLAACSFNNYGEKKGFSAAVKYLLEIREKPDRFTHKDSVKDYVEGVKRNPLIKDDRFNNLLIAILLEAVNTEDYLSYYEKVKDADLQITAIYPDILYNHAAKVLTYENYNLKLGIERLDVAIAAGSQKAVKRKEELERRGALDEKKLPGEPLYDDLPINVELSNILMGIMNQTASEGDISKFLIANGIDQRTLPRAKHADKIKLEYIDELSPQTTKNEIIKSIVAAYYLINAFDKDWALSNCYRLLLPDNSQIRVSQEVQRSFYSSAVKNFTTKDRLNRAKCLLSDRPNGAINYPEAIKLLKAIVDEKDPAKNEKRESFLSRKFSAYIYLARCYTEGIGVPQNITLALQTIYEARNFLKNSKKISAYGVPDSFFKYLREPEKPNYFYLWGLLYEAQGKIENATKYYGLASEKTPSPLTQETYADICYTYATDLLEKDEFENFDKASHLLRNAIEAGSFDACVKYGAIHYGKTETLTYYKLALDIALRKRDINGVRTAHKLIEEEKGSIEHEQRCAMSELLPLEEASHYSTYAAADLAAIKVKNLPSELNKLSDNYNIFALLFFKKHGDILDAFEKDRTPLEYYFYRSLNGDDNAKELFDVLRQNQYTDFLVDLQKVLLHPTVENIAAIFNQPNASDFLLKIKTFFDEDRYNRCPVALKIQLANSIYGFLIDSENRNPEIATWYIPYLSAYLGLSTPDSNNLPPPSFNPEFDPNEPVEELVPESEPVSDQSVELQKRLDALRDTSREPSAITQPPESVKSEEPPMTGQAAVTTQPLTMEPTAVPNELAEIMKRLQILEERTLSLTEENRALKKENRALQTEVRVLNAPSPSFWRHDDFEKSHLRHQKDKLITERTVKKRN